MSRAPDRNGKIGKVISNYPIPTIESLLARLEGCKYFSILDVRSGYHHIGLFKKSKPLTTFMMHSGKFQWNVLPFGIGIGVQTFSFVINKAIGAMEEPVLINPQVNKDYIIHCDASMFSYSGILQQTRPGTDELEPMAYFSGNFDKTQIKWNIMEKEAYTIYKSIKRFAFYITGAKTTVFSDHKPPKTSSREE